MMGENRKKGFWLDPRAKLFLILMCVLASMVAPSLGYQFILVLLIALLGVLFRKVEVCCKRSVLLCCYLCFDGVDHDRDDWHVADNVCGVSRSVP